MTSLTDEELMALLLDGDQSAIEQISDRYGPELRLFCQRMVYDEGLAEDIVQEVLMTCCRKEAAAKPSGSLRGWLYRVARNRSIDELRRKHPKARLSALNTSQGLWSGNLVPIDPVSTPSGKAVKEDRARRVQMAIDAMNEDLREVVILYFFQGLSRDQVAEAIGLSLAGMKARLSKATRELRDKLSSLDDSSL